MIKQREISYRYVLGLAGEATQIGSEWMSVSEHANGEQVLWTETVLLLLLLMMMAM